MNKPHNCPPADEIMAWMDGETTPGTSFLEHIKGCPHCQLLKSTIAGENLLLGTLLDCVPPVPDLSIRVMERIGPGRPGQQRNPHAPEHRNGKGPGFLRGQPGNH